MTDSFPCREPATRNAASVVVWSPPIVTMRGMEDFDGVEAFSPAMTWFKLSTCMVCYLCCTYQSGRTWCAFSNCCRATVLSRNISGASPQSMILAQLANVFSPTSISISFKVTASPFDNHLCRHSSQSLQTFDENPVGYLWDRIGHQALLSRPAEMLSSSSIGDWHDYCE